ncbi:MAG TPA: M56 family metallopeptidase [Bryobacteraceae bacterium]|nr:M56 family metallopeptidase [Bryobacteraceae bacterium]
MHEQLARPLYYLGVHLMYASIVWLAAWLLTSIPRGSGTIKHWIWVATSLNFILPLGAIADKSLARHLAWASPLGVIGGVGLRIAEDGVLASVLATVWLLGVALMFTRLCLRLRAERSAPGLDDHSGDDQQPAFFSQGVPVRFGRPSQAPLVSGLLRPRISLPSGIDRLLSKGELDAVLIHELTHAKRRDNLIRLVHEIGLCVLWFHPLVWITGARLSLYRELSCDESVIRGARGHELVSALAKLANPEQPFLLQSMASSFLSLRIARLTTPHPRTGAASRLLAMTFAAVLVMGVFETVAHTACCFLAKH